jgi:hypothetical protein
LVNSVNQNHVRPATASAVDQVVKWLDAAQDQAEGALIEATRAEGILIKDANDPKALAIIAQASAKRAIADMYTARAMLYRWENKQ